MTTPVVLPTFDFTNGQLYVVRVGGNATSGGIALGQLLNINPQSQVNSNKLARIGDTDKKTVYDPAEHTVSLELYTQRSAAELGLLLGATVPAAGGTWNGSVNIYLNPSMTPIDLYVDVYTAPTSGASRVQVWTLDNFKVNNFSINVQADSQNVNVTVNGDMDQFLITPLSGVTV